jgi:hypothetical protein
MGLMVDDAITLEKMDELLQFLPLFEVPGRSYVQSPASSGPGAEGESLRPYPEYCEDVLAFFWLVGQPCWSDFEYDPRQAQALLSDDAFIDTCSLEGLKTLLTYCVRSERFGDGAWLHLLESGRIAALLRRLAVLRGSL